MRAIVLEKFGGVDSLVYQDILEPEPKAGHVVRQEKEGSNMIRFVGFIAAAVAFLTILSVAMRNTTSRHSEPAPRPSKS